MKIFSVLVLKVITLMAAVAFAQSSPPVGVASNSSVISPVTEDGASTPAQLQPAANTQVPTPSAARTEEEIPVNLESPKKAATSESPIVKFGLAFGVIGILGCGSFLLLRKYQFKNGQQERMQIKVMTQHHLGPKKSLAIIRVAGESILIGVTDHNINLIKSLSLLDEDLPEDMRAEMNEDARSNSKSFNTVFSSVESKTTSFQKNEEAEDEFSFSGIRDLVSGKLKNMRNLQ